MSDLIKVPSNMLSELSFNICDIELDVTDYEEYDYPIGEDLETGAIIEEISYNQYAKENQCIKEQFRVSAFNGWYQSQNADTPFMKGATQ